MSLPQVILISGPTAGGKSHLAVELASRMGATIVNADSMQVYRELRVISARPSEADEQAAAHCLYGHVAAPTRYSVGDWLREVAVVVADAQREGRALIVVGGTGLYFKALTEGLAEVPPIPANVRSAVRARVKAEGAFTLHLQLAALDPEGAASVRPSDTTRVVRALEVVEATGQPLAEWQRAPAARPPIDPARAVRIVLSPDTTIVHERIAVRAEAMVGEGAIAEVDALLAMRLDPELPVMKAIGVREFGAHLSGDTSLDEAVAAVKTETRRYAKRQMTWFRGQMRDWQWVSDPAALDLAAVTA